MSVKKPYLSEERLKKLQKCPDFVTEGIKINLEEDICVMMERFDIDRNEWAKRMKVSKRAVTDILRGENCLKLETIVKIALAFNCTVKVSFHPNS